jgi:Xaa-Pro aminopeptidase
MVSMSPLDVSLLARRIFLLGLAALWLVPMAGAQIHQGSFTEVFPPEEFAARRAQVMDEIGDAVAILQGTIERPGEQPFRQNNQFFYLTGVEVPRAIVALDGRSRSATLYLPPRNERRERSQGPEIYVGPEAVELTGLDAVVARDDFAAVVDGFASDGRVFYTPHRPEVLGNASAGDVRRQARATSDDPWDGRPAREEVFIAKLRAAAPDSEIRDLDPVLDAMRVIKSEREIDVIREATRITGLAIVEVMREAEPGMREYELQSAAEYVFKKYGSQGAAYFALIATGSNTFYSHYHRGTRVLVDGDLVQYDYAPDYRYYVSDITRAFPANGTFTPLQRELYTIYLRMYRAVLSSIRPGEPVAGLLQEAGRKMDAIIADFEFTNPHIRTAAEQFAARYRESTRNSFGHAIGMAVHDVGGGSDPSIGLRPGQVFTIEPAIKVPELDLAMRLEDVLLVTEDGYENLSYWVPIEIDDIERVMAEPGISRLIEKR